MSTSQPVAAGVSSSKPLPGQSNRSSQNFQFLAVPGSGNVTVSINSNPNGGQINCKLMQDVTGTDPVIASLAQGTSFPAAQVQTGNNYYLSNPANSGGLNFEVTFSASV
ncbi:MAG TPA: hypothetical protein VGH73_12075 [Thermoanaerobaculia bacterium]|jgi:hypothetical protein